MNFRENLLLFFIILSQFLVFWAARGSEVPSVIAAVIMLAAFIALFFTSSPESPVRNKEKRAQEDTFSTPSPFILPETSEDNDDLFRFSRIDFKKEIRKKMEAELNSLLAVCVKTAEEICNTNTVIIFFRGKGQFLVPRITISRSDSVRRDVKIEFGKGLVGNAAKGNGRVIVENDLRNDSRTLMYYSRDEKVRSFIAVPLMVRGELRGVFTADSKEAGNFDSSGSEFMERLANITSHMVFYGLYHQQNYLDLQAVRALSLFQKEFFKKDSIEGIISYMAEIIKNTIGYDRLTVALRSEEEKNGKGVRIKFADGDNADFFREFSFSLDEKGLISLVFEKGVIIKRALEQGRYVPRFTSREKVNDKLSSVLAVPVMDGEECTGVVCLESMNKDRYGHIEKDFVSGLAGAAGLAMKKVRLIEVQTNLATRDGLTGLINHREFQKSLSAEIKRSGRYRNKAGVGFIIADIDHFKSINDTYGHPVGDVILRETAKIMKNCVRSGLDLVARYGGEEFACILAEADERILMETAERKRSSVE
ncbi:MAG: diguanylate cyclase, partial [Fibrobacterota bacterium]